MCRRFNSAPSHHFRLRVQQWFAWLGSPNGHQNGHQFSNLQETSVVWRDPPAIRYLFGFGLVYLRGCVKTMKTRYRLICRGTRGGAYYCVDTKTGKRTSLGTTNADDAQQIIEAKSSSGEFVLSPWQVDFVGAPKLWKI